MLHHLILLIIQSVTGSVTIHNNSLDRFTTLYGVLTYVAESPTCACRGALAVACAAGFGSALTSTHMYVTPSNTPHHTKCDG